MKKITLALVAFMLVLGMTQCKKEQQPNNTPTADGETVYISMKVADNGGKHVVYPGTGAVVYGNGDKIYVGNNGKYVGTLTYANGTFSGSITNPSTSDYLHFYFTGGKTPATNPTAGSTTSFTVDISNQSSKLPVLSYGHSTSKYIDGTTAYTCMLENQCGLVKFVPSIATSKVISVGGMKTTATINFASGSEGITPVDATGAVTLYSVSDTEKWAILLPQNEVENPTVTISGYKHSSVTVPAVTPNMYINSGVTITMPLEGTINGLFTIGSNQVYFSYGNLQYIGSASTSYWKFADNQWDYLGKTTGQNSSNQNVDRDLFGWGTSGYNHGANCYQPWSTSTTYSDYYDNNLTGQADWGYNPISNGGNQPNQWRTLTRWEWEYVFKSRTTPSGIRYAMANVNNINGVILLPDDWNASYYSLRSTNSDGSFSGNTITASQWSALEQAGAVFLPAAGLRYGTSVSLVGSYGNYWSSSINDYDGEGYQWYFYDYYAGSVNDRNDIYEGFSVRLVRDVN